MKKPTVKYSKGEIGRVRIVEDFLPSPDRMVLLTDAQVDEVRRRRAGSDGKLVSPARARKRIDRLGSQPNRSPDIAALIRATLLSIDVCLGTIDARCYNYR